MNAPAKHRVLLVEDSAPDALLLQESFVDQPEFEVVHVTRLSDALRSLQGELFDLVLLDLGLPDSKGVETFVRMHQSAPTVPVLVLTALDDAKVELQALQNGAQDYVVKRAAMQPEVLAKSVRSTIERTQAARRIEEMNQREAREREMHNVDRLAAEPVTAVTARIY